MSAEQLVTIALAQHDLRRTVQGLEDRQEETATALQELQAAVALLDEKVKETAESDDAKSVELTTGIASQLAALKAAFDRQAKALNAQQCAIQELAALQDQKFAAVELRMRYLEMFGFDRTKGGVAAAAKQGGPAAPRSSSSGSRRKFLKNAPKPVPKAQPLKIALDNDRNDGQKFFCPLGVDLCTYLKKEHLMTQEEWLNYCPMQDLGSTVGEFFTKLSALRQEMDVESSVNALFSWMILRGQKSQQIYEGFNCINEDTDQTTHIYRISGQILAAYLSRCRPSGRPYPILHAVAQSLVHRGCLKPFGPIAPLRLPSEETDD